MQLLHLLALVPKNRRKNGWNALRFFFKFSVQFSHSVMSDSLWLYELQHARPPCPSPNTWSLPKLMSIELVIHLTILSLSSTSPPAFNLFQHQGIFKTQLFVWGGQSIGVSASTSVLPKNIQDWSPLGWTAWISLQSKGLSRIFSNTTVQKHQFFRAHPSSQSKSHIHTWLLEKP